MSKYETEEDYARCISETPAGELPECYRGWGFTNPTTGARWPIENGLPPRGLWIPADAEEMRGTR